MFELFGKEGLGLYGVRPDAAVTWAVAFHFLSYVPITIIGAYYFLRAGLSLGEISSVEHEATTDAQAVSSVLPPRA